MFVSTPLNPIYRIGAFKPPSPDFVISRMIDLAAGMFRRREAQEYFNG